ncbi:MAG: amidase [Phreatobacter sp.]
MASDDLCNLSATDLAMLVAARKISPVEVVDAILARVDRLEPKLNMFAELTADTARAAARAAETAVMAGTPLGPLHGVPITIKDNVAVKGLALRNGSRAAADVVAPADAAVVARIKAAGAIMIGKTTLPEFAHKVLTDSPLHGITRNPWSLDHTPGGSSGGASAALACGIAPLAVGTDGGGSIRCPASCTGVAGIKATLGRIPNEVMPDGFANFAFVGPMARDAGDVALLLSVMAGPLASDPYSIGAPTSDLRAPVADGAAKGLRIGWVEHFGRYRTDPEVARLTRAAVMALAGEGASVEELRDPCFDDVFETYVVLATTAHATRLGPLAERFGDAMTESLRASIARGIRYSAVEWQRAGDKRTTLFRSVQRLFERFDIIATPTMLAPPTRVDAGGSIETAMYAEWAAPLYPFNLTGHPAASVPAGLTAEGLPVGLQLVGRWFAEPRILDVAALLERLQEPVRQPPIV